jgi:hypothetical protein
VFCVPAHPCSCRGRGLNQPWRHCPALPNLYLSPHPLLRQHRPRSRLRGPSTTPTATRFVQLAQHRSGVANLAMPANSTVTGTASAANDHYRRVSDNCGRRPATGATVQNDLRQRRTRSRTHHAMRATPNPANSPAHHSNGMEVMLPHGPGLEPSRPTGFRFDPGLPGTAHGPGQAGHPRTPVRYLEA